MKLPRLRFTLLGMTLLVEILAVALAVGQWAKERMATPTVPRTYYVGALLEPPVNGKHDNGSRALTNLASRLKWSVTPDAWWLWGHTVTPFYLSQSLIVRTSEGGHQRVVACMKDEKKQIELQGAARWK